jgi:hypothetical protein
MLEDVGAGGSKGAGNVGAGSANVNKRKPKSWLGLFFNSKLGRFGMHYMVSALHALSHF